MNNIISLCCCCIAQMQQQYSCRHWLIWFKGETTTMQSIDLPLTLALDSLFTILSSFTLKVVLVLSKVSHSDWVDMCLDSLNNKVCKGLDLLVGGIVFEQHRCFNFSVQVLVFRIQIVWIVYIHHWAYFFPWKNFSCVSQTKWGLVTKF